PPHHAATAPAPADNRRQEDDMKVTHTEHLGEPEQHRVTREGARDLAFRGRLLGTGEHGTGGNSGCTKDWTRGVHVRIYLTTGGRLVLAVHRWTRWQGEPDRYTATARDTPDTAIDWLVEDAGRLGAASKAAWEDACTTWPPLAGEDVEDVDNAPWRGEEDGAAEDISPAAEKPPLAVRVAELEDLTLPALNTRLAAVEAALLDLADQVDSHGVE
ncbi:MAG: hypothetical protein KJ725_20295, partial [Gammaproteobacteria bacterium]|nr:hypothetical protein [Gammaproteobacteria bacterium]